MVNLQLFTPFWNLMIFTIHVNKSKKYIYNHEVKKNGRKNKIQEHVLVYMDQDMIEFYLTYKQNQSCKL
jgi:hypothetical protein